MGEVIALARQRARRQIHQTPTCRSRSTFFFDLGCPFSYLAQERIDRLFIGVDWCPAVAHGIHHPNPWSIESVHVIVERRARELGLPLIWPPTEGCCPRRAMRVALHAVERGRAAQFALAAGRLAFCGGYDLEQLDVVAEAAAAAGLDPDLALRAANDERLDEKLDETGRRLLAAGATSLPVLAIGRTLHCGEATMGQAAAAQRAAREGDT